MSNGIGSSARSPIQLRLVAVVDDDPSIVRSLQSLFLSSGFRVQTFQSARAFLAGPELAETGCLVLDLSMPGMSGPELVSHLDAIHRPVPFVVLTAVSDNELKERMMQKGAVAWLQKPASGPDLLGAVRTAFEKHPSVLLR